jgi:hypothetical protein
MSNLAKMSDDEIRSLIGRANAELNHRQRVRSVDFVLACRLLEEHRGQTKYSPSPPPLSSAGND